MTRKLHPHISIPLCLIFVLILFPTLDSFASDRGKKEFWINKYGEIKESQISIRAQEVFNRVLAAADKRVGIEPALYIINYDGTPWAQSLADGSIILTKKGLEFCYKNQSPEEGDARLAFVIGHELAHQFNGDFWEYRFLRTAEESKDGMQAFQDIKELAKNREMLLAKELQADQYGIIYSALAGYKTDAIVSKDENFFLEWAEKENPYIYFQKDLLQLPKKRAMAVAMRLKEVADRVALFQLGVVSYHIGRYDDALSLFNRFASYFPSREVYSNIGTIYLRKAYEKFLLSRTPDSFPFLLSFGIDIKTRADIINISRGFTEERYREYKRLIKIANENLKKAIEYDPFYQEAKNSLGCVYILENKYYDAVSILEEALKSSPDNRKIQNNLSVAYILLGQEVGSSDLIEKAKKILMAVKEEDYIAENNREALSLMEGKSSNIPLTSNLSKEPSHDFIIKFTPSLKFKPGMKVSNKGQLNVVEEITNTSQGVLKILKAQNGKLFLLTKDNIIRLIIYKEPSGLKTDMKGNERIGIYVSRAGKNGVILSKNNSPDYFEF
ncbi:MAG: tetratricopeptide repeat protein [Nitrospirota bacterium]|jgi:tetratricopeptide (TPR) repeat protein